VLIKATHEEEELIGEFGIDNVEFRIVEVKLVTIVLLIGALEFEPCLRLITEHFTLRCQSRLAIFLLHKFFPLPIKSSFHFDCLLACLLLFLGFVSTLFGCAIDGVVVSVVSIVVSVVVSIVVSIVVSVVHVSLSLCLFFLS